MRNPLFYYVFLGLSLLSGVYLFQEKLIVFFGMLLVDYIIFDKMPSRINQNQVPDNLTKSLGAAFFAFVIFFFVTLGVTFMLQSTAFFQGNIQSTNALQSIMRHGFASTGLPVDSPIFADSKFLTYFFYGLVIPFVETRFIIRLMEFLAQSFNAELKRINIKLIMIYIVVGGLFVWLHLNVKGVEDNVALLMTFIFAIITFELARIGWKVRSLVEREMESATYLHVINNMVFIANKIGF